MDKAPIQWICFGQNTISVDSSSVFQVASMRLVFILRDHGTMTRFLVIWRPFKVAFCIERYLADLTSNYKSHWWWRWADTDWLAQNIRSTLLWHECKMLKCEWFSYWGFRSIYIYIYDYSFTKRYIFALLRFNVSLLDGTSIW